MCMGYTKKQLKTLAQKWVPRNDREYIVTDSCFFATNPPAEYNPHDPKRSPHTIQLVDKETGTVVNLLSGSVVKIVSVREEKTEE